MDTAITPTLIERCNELSQAQELAVSWSGGGDSGCFNVLVNDAEIGEEPLCEALIAIVSEAVGYWSFDGDFDAEGTVVYDPETQTFEGYDNCTEKTWTNRTCCMEVSIPESLWFDQLLLTFTNEENDCPEVEVQFRIEHGPKSPLHTRTEKLLRRRLSEALNQELKYLDDVADMWEEYSIARSDFIKQGNMLSYTIPEFGYSTYRTATQEIFIDLNEHLNKQYATAPAIML